MTIEAFYQAGKQVAAFTVGGVDKKSELVADPVNQYTFNMPAAAIEVAERIGARHLSC